MTLKTFFTGKIIALCILLIIVLSFFGYNIYISFVEETEVLESSIQENLEDINPLVFTWEFEYDDTISLDTYPKTNIFLKATRYDGKVDRKFVDIVTGACNVLPDSEQDSLSGSDNIQCYYAGLGYRYKITKEESLYLVQRKMFEEGSPDYNPPVYEYEVVLKF